jgi:DNA-binding NtrC family response regulator
LRGLDAGAMVVRSVVLASGDVALRTRLKTSLVALRWTVYEANGGAEAMAQIEQARPEAVMMDSWLPDLEAGEFAAQLHISYPAMDLLRLDGKVENGGTRSARRNELLHALREATESAPLPAVEAATHVATGSVVSESIQAAREETIPVRELDRTTLTAELLPEMIGRSALMRELTRMIRLVAPRSATVLIEGETGSGKEVVAKAIHRLSTRAGKSFTVLNCAAIPESLLEAELFGHTRGAFTGAVQSRTGRIEAANGGTLFLDEIGEMPLALQAKMLRFLECGELQRVGDNETMRVDVRVIAATHQPLEQRAAEQRFRLDLYHRLAVFPLEVPALRERMDDLDLLVEFILERLGREMPRKQLTSGAFARLEAHDWPGNVRELMHVLERAAILAGDRPAILPEDIRIRRTASAVASANA